MDIIKTPWTTSAGYFISGAAIGAALGVLFAPKAGRQTQQELSLWLKEKRKLGRAEVQAMKDALEMGRKAFRAKDRPMSV